MGRSTGQSPMTDDFVRQSAPPPLRAAGDRDLSTEHLIVSPRLLTVQLPFLQIRFTSPSHSEMNRLSATARRLLNQPTRAAKTCTAHNSCALSAGDAGRTHPTTTRARLIHYPLCTNNTFLLSPSASSLIFFMRACEQASTSGGAAASRLEAYLSARERRVILPTAPGEEREMGRGEETGAGRLVWTANVMLGCVYMLRWRTRVVLLLCVYCFVAKRVLCIRSDQQFIRLHRVHSLAP